jgi:hypothetical protein
MNLIKNGITTCSLVWSDKTGTNQPLYVTHWYNNVKGTIIFEYIKKLYKSL